MELRKALVGMCLLGGLAIGAGPVVAHEITFAYTADGGFLPGTDAGIAPPVTYHNDDNSPCVAPECHGVNWGVGTPDPDVNSGLHLGSAAGFVTTDGPLVDFGSLLHHNSPITSFFEGSVDLNWHLTLSTLGGTVVKVIDLAFRIYVNETLNFPGDVDDEFTYELISGPLSDVFYYQGDTYKVSLSGFYDAEGNLTSIFFSPEGGTNIGFVKFNLEHIPAPGALVLMLTGLVAVAIGARRKRQIG